MSQQKHLLFEELSTLRRQNQIAEDQLYMMNAKLLELQNIITVQSIHSSSQNTGGSNVVQQAATATAN